MLADRRVQYGAGILVSALILVLSFMGVMPDGLGSNLEYIGTITLIWSVLLLARNNPLGWWVGLVSVVAYMIVFYNVQLYAETGIQAFYFFTSLQAIYIWLRGGVEQTEKPVSHASWRWIALTVPLFIIAFFGIQWLLIRVNGAAPFWDALTTVMSLTAHIYLMWRFIESWYIWIAVDIIYVPLYYSRGLTLTSILYAGLLFMSINGLMNFRRVYMEQRSDQTTVAQMKVVTRDIGRHDG